jgi:hypothetical protein
MLDDDQRELLDQATAIRDGLTDQAKTIDDAKQIASEGVARIPWRTCGHDGEDELAKLGISVRCLLHEDGQPVNDPSSGDVEALLARAH